MFVLILLKEKSVQSWASPLRFLRSLNHLIRSRQDIRRNRDVDLLRVVEINDQLELRWLLRETGGLALLKITEAYLIT